MPKVQRYVSTELTHFVGRGKAQEDQYALLVHILQVGSRIRLITRTLAGTSPSIQAHQ